MVKTILAGLLVAGVAPAIVVEEIAIEHNLNQAFTKRLSTETVNSDLLCSLPNSGKVCNSFSKNKSRQFSSDFNLPTLARLLGSRSNPLKCVDRSPEQKWQSPEKQLDSSFSQSKCIFPWQNRLIKKPIVKQNAEVLSQPNSQEFKDVASTGSSVISTQFPKLNRSSLIVAFPQQINTSFKPEKLANPAPATKRIASSFGWRTRPYSNQRQFHQGIDYGAPLGSPVVAIGKGIVTKVSSGCADFGNLFCGGQLGNWIEIDHGNGAIATYGHLKNSSIAIKQGMKVQKNQQIAQVGSSGWSTGAHLDFRLKINGEYKNPAQYVVAVSKIKI